jgi:spore maturation protein CgeB
VRILMVHPGPDFSVADVYRGWYKALKSLGHEVMSYNTNDRLTFYGHARMEDTTGHLCGECGQYPHKQAMPDNEAIMQMAMKGLSEACYIFWPDVVFFVSAFYTTAATLQLLRMRDHKIVMLHTESPYQDDEQMMRGQFADLNLLNDPVNMELWKERIGGTAAYMRHSYDPDVHYPADRKVTPYESDFSFVGTAFASRQKFFHDMQLHETGLDVTFGGNGWDYVKPEYADILQYLGHPQGECVDNEETARIYRISKTGINFYRQEGEATHAGEGVAMGPREVEMAACGLFFLRDPRPESDNVFGHILPSFDSAESAASQLKYWASHDDAREHLARKARAAIADRTFDNAAVQAMELMEIAGIC